ncbi:hypothetical protein G3M74_16765 [Paenibacillus polymyxa]|nr:hypothetical protein [Paenibacillus polymyxa]
MNEKDFVNREMGFLCELADLSDELQAAFKISIREAFREGFARGEDYSRRRFNKKMLIISEKILGEIEEERRIND